MTPQRGELWWCEPPDIGPRPVVVLSRNLVIERRQHAIVAPCTTTVRGLASEVQLEPGDDPVSRRSAVNLDAIDNAPIGVFIERMGALSDMRMQQICAALEVAVDCTY